MSCNCTTTEQINELYRKYGEKTKEKKEQSLKFRLKTGFMKFAVGFCLVFITPIIFFYVICKGFSKNRQIDVSKFFKLTVENNG